MGKFKIIIEPSAYRVEENIVTIFIIAALGHYSDK
jgi:hypothetical protein